MSPLSHAAMASVSPRRTAMIYCRLAQQMATQRMGTAQSPSRTSQKVRRRRLLRRLRPRSHAQCRRSRACHLASTQHRWLNCRHSAVAARVATAALIFWHPCTLFCSAGSLMRLSSMLSVQVTMATEMMRNNPGMMSMMENMVGGMSQEQLDAMVGNGLCIYMRS